MLWGQSQTAGTRAEAIHKQIKADKYLIITFWVLRIAVKL